jgi:hypothetical protein
LKAKSGQHCDPMENGTGCSSAHRNNELPRRHQKGGQSLAALAKERHSNHSSALLLTLRNPVQSRPVNDISHSSVPLTPHTRPLNPKTVRGLGPVAAHSSRSANPSSTTSPMKKRSRYTFRRIQTAPRSTVRHNSNGNATPLSAHPTAATPPQLQLHQPSPIPPTT